MSYLAEQFHGQLVTKPDVCRIPGAEEVVDGRSTTKGLLVYWVYDGRMDPLYAQQCRGWREDRDQQLLDRQRVKLLRRGGPDV